MMHGKLTDVYVMNRSHPTNPGTTMLDKCLIDFKVSSGIRTRAPTNVRMPFIPFRPRFDRSGCAFRSYWDFVKSQVSRCRITRALQLRPCRQVRPIVLFQRAYDASKPLVISQQYSGNTASAQNSLPLYMVAQRSQ